MGRINILGFDVANLIAAGEVIKDLTHFDREHR